MIARAISKVKLFVAWIDQHPRTGWYIAAIVTANLMFDLLQALL